MPPGREEILKAIKDEDDDPTCPQCGHPMSCHLGGAIGCVVINETETMYPDCCGCTVEP